MKIEANAAIIQAILAKYNINSKIISIIPLQELRENGQSRLLYHIYLNDQNELVCRVSSEQNFPYTLIEQQCIFSEKLRHYGIPVAKKYKAGQTYCISKYYEGHTYCITIENFAGTDIKNVDLHLFGQLGKLLGKMHRISESDPTEIDYSPVTNGLKNGKAKFAKILTGLDSQVIGLECVRKAARMHDRLALLLRQGIDKLPHGAVHGDLGIFNNLLTNDGQYYIIDFNLASDETYLLDMVICFYSSINKYMVCNPEKKFGVADAFTKFTDGYYSERQLNDVERVWYAIAAALFDGLYYCKAVIEKYRRTGDKECLEKLAKASDHFAIGNHQWNW